MSEPSLLEKVASSLPAKGAANTVSVLGATITPLAAFVPFLVEALASGRQSERLEAMFRDLRALTEANAAKLRDLTDDQYKVVNEAISAAFYTIDQEKIEILKRAAANAFLNPDAVMQVSDSLSRVVRDISSSEVAFVVLNFGYERIVIANEPLDVQTTLTIKPHSSDEVVLSGLVNLGLLYPKRAQWDTVPFEWSPLVARLIRLLNDA